MRNAKCIIICVKERERKVKKEKGIKKERRKREKLKKDVRA